MILNGVSGSRVLCVGAVVTDGRGRLLLIQRGHEPGQGLWSLPGGRVEPGETDAEALVREMEEETGLTVEPGRLIGQVLRPGLAGAVLDIRDYAATVTGGTLRPGDDAADARWVDPGDLSVLAVTEGLVEALTEWGVLGQEQALLSRFSVLSLRVPFVPHFVRVLRVLFVPSGMGLSEVGGGLGLLWLWCPVMQPGIWPEVSLVSTAGAREPGARR
jgi:ADP-ribose pyrophosphatase YjhB (NUDIX family)